MNYSRLQMMDSLDATVFSSDALHDEEFLCQFKDYLARWGRAVAEHEKEDVAAPPVNVASLSLTRTALIAEFERINATRYARDFRSQYPTAKDDWDPSMYYYERTRQGFASFVDGYNFCLSTKVE